MGFRFRKQIFEIEQAERKKSNCLLVVTVLLLITNIATLAYFLYKNRENTNAYLNNPYPLVDPARSHIPQEHFFSTIQPLRQQLRDIVARQEEKGNKVGIYFEFINTGSSISINQEERFWPASLSKMPTAFAAMKKIEKGEWKLSNELVLFSEDQDDRFGELYKKTPGTRFTIEELIKESLIKSDNTAHRILVRNLASEDYTDIFEALGVEELYDENYDITAKEYSRIFRSLYSASYLDRENSQKLLLWGSETPFNYFLGQGVPPKIKFSHKIGEAFEEIVYLDSGIVYIPNRPYLITVMVKINDGGGEERAKEIMKEISKAAYDYVANN